MNMNMNFLIHHWQELTAKGALEELKQLALQSDKLAFKAIVDGSEVKRGCLHLSTQNDKRLSSNAEIVKRLSQSQPWAKKINDGNAYFSQAFLALTAISAPWKRWVLERNDPEFTKSLDKLLNALVQTSKGRVMVLQASIDAVTYQQELLTLWLENPPALPTSAANEEKGTFVYRGVTYRINALGALLTLAAQTNYYVAGLKALAVQSKADFTIPSGEASAANILSLIRVAPWWPEEQFANEVLENAKLIRAKATSFFFHEQELGDLTQDEYRRILEVRVQLFSALTDCNQSTIEAYKAQLKSTDRIIELTGLMRERVKTARESKS